jgi:hypothetical protein
MKSLRYGVFLVIVGGLFLSCGTVGKPPMSDIPDFYLNPPTAEDAIYGVGDANMSSHSLSLSTAKSRATNDIARQVQVVVKSAITDYAQQAGAGRNEQTITFVETISRQIVEVELQGLRTIEVATGRDGTIYVLMEYPIRDFLADAETAFTRNEDAAFAEFKAAQALERLNYELENNPPQAGGK